MIEVSQEVAVILPILQLLLEEWLTTDVSRYFRFSYTMETERYKWNNALYQVIPTGENNYIEGIDIYWIQNTKAYTTRNKDYKDEDHGGYSINIGSFDIADTIATNDRNATKLY